MIRRLTSLKRSRRTSKRRTVRRAARRIQEPERGRATTGSYGRTGTGSNSLGNGSCLFVFVGHLLKPGNPDRHRRMGTEQVGEEALLAGHAASQRVGDAEVGGALPDGA